jgi:hypothetical protein
VDGLEWMERRWSKMKRVSEMSVREMGVWKGMLEVRSDVGRVDVGWW